jgi:chromosome segregation ATPase
VGTGDRYKDWLDDFENEVSKAMEGMGSGAHAAAEKAIDGFSHWWQGEHPSSSDDPAPDFRSETVNKELELRLAEIQAMKAELESLKAAPDARELKAARERIDALEREKAGLQEANQLLGSENQRLRDYRSSIERQVAELRAKMSRAQDDYEAQIRRLQDRTQHLNEQLAALHEGKQFLLAEHSRQVGRLDASEAELKSLSGEKAALERERDALALKAEGLERALEEKARAQAELEGRVSELRQQAAAAERSSEDSGAVRAEMDGARREIAALAGQHEEARRQLLQRQQEGEQMLRQAAQFLEAKLREFQDEWRERHP